jgi:hypothetical protein
LSNLSNEINELLIDIYVLVHKNIIKEKLSDDGDNILHIINVKEIVKISELSLKFNVDIYLWVENENINCKLKFKNSTDLILWELQHD